jgi:hypothetical protein
VTDEEILEIAIKRGVWVPMGINVDAGQERSCIIAMARKIESIIEENYKAEIKHWRSNHDNMVSRCAILSTRMDLPAERTVAYRELIRLQNENVELKNECAKLKSSVL